MAENEQLLEFAQALGGAFNALTAKLEAQQAELDAYKVRLGEPVVVVEPPVVNVAGAEVAIDVAGVSEAISALSSDGIVTALKALVEKDLDLSLIADAIGTASPSVAIASLSDKVAAIGQTQLDGIALQEGLVTSLTGLAASVEKVMAATQMQFTSVLEAMQVSEKRAASLERAIIAPKRIIEVDGKPMGVETVIN